ncbi:fibrobacter succinogenes major paralogous domain-containing protein [uncultured Fibrobacter sp.]|uniref:fibrobacter succinogenes major paralogous domain-containing protein n=1 Tax=uncultured Fibrobacter sp. TaxID=261512 RepID=UPI00261FFE17|nr:fibrobacter succinogenes major paralogous domain-containing protein [uncultured Fibrobacter sp.]
MKKIFVALCMVAFLAACDDSSSASAGANDEPGVESSSSSSGKAGEPAEVTSSSSEKAKSSSSDTQSDVKQSSSSEKTGKSSSSSKDIGTSSSSESEKVSSSSVKSESSSSVENSQSSSSDKTSVSSSSESVEPFSSSAGKVNCPALLEGETGWSWDVPKECRFNPDITYGSMTDERDGKVYKTVIIGTQVWMAENLNYYDAADLNVKEKSWCFGKSDNGDSTTCDVSGRLYTWAAAMDSVGAWSTNGKGCGDGKTCTLTATVQGVCPEGWHLPSFSEWYTLFTAVGGSTPGKVLKSQTGWNSDGNGTDAFGFAALPAGLRGVRNYDVYFLHDGGYASFWSSTENSSDLAYSMLLDYISADAGLGNASKGLAFYVRCLRD